MSNALTTLTGKLADRFGMGDGTDLANTLKATCFKGQNQVTDAQMTMLLVIAQQYGLNPFTREIYAFPDKGGIVPVVGVDGWARIINSHTQFDGMDFELDDDKCTCIMFRKDRSHPVKITEYMAECRRDNAQPWKSHPRRMLRHKAMIQCARVAFGFSGIYDQDEAERIIEGPKDMGAADVVRDTVEWHPDQLAQAIAAARQGAKAYGAFWKSLNPDAQAALVKTPEHAGFKAQAVQADAARTVETPPAQGETFASVMQRLLNANNADELGDAASWIEAVEDAQQQEELGNKFRELLTAMEAA